MYRWILLLIGALVLLPADGMQEDVAAAQANQGTMFRPLVDEQQVEQVMSVLDEFMRSFNALDIEAHRQTYHFPHYRLASGQMRVLETREELNQDQLKKFLEGIGWHHSAWVSREISMASGNKVHVNTRFTRFRADGSEIGSYDSLYILTLEEGTWGIKLRSSFAQ
jgi:hypothetical protein